MGTALVGGLLAAGWQAAAVAIAESDAARRAEVAAHLPGIAVGDAPVAAEGAVLAVKPVDAEVASRVLAGTGTPRVLSIMAGVPLTRLRTWLGPSVAALRAMPNTPALIGAGVSALAGAPDAEESDFAWAEEILHAVGSVVRLPESSLDAATGLSGSGPAYVFLVAEALIAAGVAAGLDVEVSRTLAVQTLVGASRLLHETGQDPVALRAQVTSPGGTTEAGVARLEARGVRSAFVEAVAAATARSREMSGE